MPNSREAVPDIFDPALAMALTRIFFSNIGGIFSTGLLVLFTVLFILLEAAGMPAKLKAAFSPTAETEARIQKMLSSINQYMVIKTLASLATAFFIWIWLWYLGLDFAILWALLAFLLNFVPFVGSILMAAPAILLALVQTDISTTLLVALGYLVVNTAIGSILEPRFMGKGLGHLHPGGLSVVAVLGLCVRHRGGVPVGTADHGADHRPGCQPPDQAHRHTPGPRPGPGPTRPQAAQRRPSPVQTAPGQDREGTQ